MLVNTTTSRQYERLDTIISKLSMLESVCYTECNEDNAEDINKVVHQLIKLKCKWKQQDIKNLKKINK